MHILEILWRKKGVGKKKKIVEDVGYVKNAGKGENTDDIYHRIIKW